MTENHPYGPPRRSGKGLNAAIVVLVILVIAALGGVGYLLVQRNKDTSSASAAEPSASAPASTTSPSTSAAPSSPAAPAGRSVTHASGKFTVLLPDNGWQVDAKSESTIAPGSASIYTAPDLEAYKKGAGKVTGFAVVDLTGTQNTPEQYVAAAKESNRSGCEWSAPKTFTYKDFTGTFVDRAACSTPAPDGSTVQYDSIQLGVSRADGTKVGMVIRDAPGETSTRELGLQALESIKHN